MATVRHVESRGFWSAALAVLGAGLSGWMVSFRCVMWTAMEYDGHYTPPEQLAAARRRHARLAPLLTIGAVAAVAAVLNWVPAR